MIFVPLNRKCLATSGFIVLELILNSCRDPSVAGTFETGTDSPKMLVNMVTYELWAQLLHTSKHALIDNTVSCEQQAITRKLRQ